MFCLRLCNALFMNSKTCLKRPLKKKTKIIFQDRLSLNAGQKYCNMLPLEHSAILLTCIDPHSFIKLLFAIKTFVLSIFEWLLKTGYTVSIMYHISGLLGSNIKREWENLMIPEIESSSDQESVDDVWSINDEQREYYLKQFQNIEPDVNGQITGKSECYLKRFPN